MMKNSSLGSSTVALDYASATHPERRDDDFVPEGSQPCVGYFSDLVTSFACSVQISRTAIMHCIHNIRRIVIPLFGITFPVPVSTLIGWHPNAHRSVRGIISEVPWRSMAAFEMAKYIPFQRHEALLIMNNATCRLSK